MVVEMFNVKALALNLNLVLKKILNVVGLFISLIVVHVNVNNKQ